MSGGVDGWREQVGAWVGVLAERNFRLFFIGFTTSVVGAAMVPVALTFAVLDSGAGVGAVGEVLASETVPLVVLLLIGGVVADRFPRKVGMLTSDVVRFFSQGTLAVLLLTGHPPIWFFMAMAAVIGAGEAFFNPALTGLIPEMVPEGRLQQANALRGIAFSTGQLLGPSVAGVIVAAGGAGWAIAIDAATYAVSALCLVGLRIPAHPPGRSVSMLRQLLDGWREFRSRTWLWLIVAQFATFNALTFAPFMVLGAAVAKRDLGGAAPWGAIEAVFGAGSIAGGILAVRVRTRRPLVTGSLVAATFAIPVALVAVPAPAWLIALGAGIAGIGFSIFDTVWETTLQREVPRAVLSRVSAYDWFGSIAFLPIGFAIAGPLASRFGIRDMLIFAAVWALSPLLVLGSRSVRSVRSP
ncbi:MAG: MFS transporter [Candidatus Dormibacteraceae bacterium]